LTQVYNTDPAQSVNTETTVLKLINKLLQSIFGQMKKTMWGTADLNVAVILLNKTKTR